MVSGMLGLANNEFWVRPRQNLVCLVGTATAKRDAAAKLELPAHSTYPEVHGRRCIALREADDSELRGNAPYL